MRFRNRGRQGRLAGRRLGRRLGGRRLGRNTGPCRFNGPGHGLGGRRGRGLGRLG